MCPGPAGLPLQGVPPWLRPILNLGHLSQLACLAVCRGRPRALVQVRLVIWEERKLSGKESMLLNCGVGEDS